MSLQKAVGIISPNVGGCFKYLKLVSFGIELVFLIVASMGLCFGFMLKTVLTTQGCFLYC